MAVPDSSTSAEAPRRRDANARREAHSVTAGLGARIKALRAERGLSLRSVAAEAQVSPSLLSQIERGEASPSLISLVAIADALDVRPGRLLEEDTADAPAPSPVVRREERRVVDDERCRREYLMHLDDPYLEVAELIVAPGGASRPELAHHSGRDYGVVITGEIVIEFEDGRAETLKRGDYIAFDAEIPHRAVNRSGRQARVLWIIAHDRADAVRQRRDAIRGV
jgi:transcriptional regulator with XRE-family HTH domain